MKIKMLRQEAYCGITGFYDAIARRLGYNIDKVEYDCKDIDVSENIFEEIYQWYQDTQNVGQESMGMMWCCFGPKVNESLKDYEVVIGDKFIKEVAV